MISLFLVVSADHRGNTLYLKFENVGQQILLGLRRACICLREIEYSRDSTRPRLFWVKRIYRQSFKFGKTETHVIKLFGKKLHNTSTLQLPLEQMLPFPALVKLRLKCVGIIRTSNAVSGFIFWHIVVTICYIRILKMLQ